MMMEWIGCCYSPEPTGEQDDASSPLQQDSFWLTPHCSAAWPTVVVVGSISGLADGAAMTAAKKVAAMAKNCILIDWLVGSCCGKLRMVLWVLL